MKVWIFTISYNESVMIGYFLRHYSTFADKIIVFDEQSTDGTRDIIKSFPKAELRPWPHKGLDDNRFLEAVNNWYKEARGKADWVMWPDVDELLWHPDPLKSLEHDMRVVQSNIVQAEGFGMISESGPPKHDGQIYEVCNKGIRQDNYDKYIIWRPEIDIKHQHGRHTYLAGDGRVEHPIVSGPRSDLPWFRSYCPATQSGWKLLHYHYFGTAYTQQRNQRNYERAVDKKYAWNYAPKANFDPKQNGSVAWVEKAIKGGRLQTVVPGQVQSQASPRKGEVAGMTSEGKLRKIQLGSGGLNIPGFENYDVEVDLRKKLPFPDNSCSHIVMNHCVEHITHQEAWNFFEECRRVLVVGGRVRIGIPDFCRLWTKITPAYCAKVKEGGHGDGTDKAAMRAMVFEHGHKSVWNQDLLSAMLEVIGFDIRLCEYGKSEDSVLCGVDLHGLTVGEDIAKVETSCVEGVK